ncbi:Hypothetical_protein [Hexamita inflata]|uniref:Hypothetical_protein n=1 Tax=Hexamita inflata TaxID=28002 RepID=A0AA86UQT4_9EUKA|nr:Hypothetical protein HINF_LOCUS52034 [Hexamita inflata]
MDPFSLILQQQDQNEFKKKANNQQILNFYIDKYLKLSKYNVDDAVNLYKNNIQQFMEITGVAKEQAIQIFSNETDFEKALYKWQQQQELQENQEAQKKSSNVECNQNVGQISQRERNQLFKQFKKQTNNQEILNYKIDTYLQQANYDVGKAINIFQNNVQQYMEITGVTVEQAVKTLSNETNFEIAIKQWQQQQGTTVKQQYRKQQQVEQNYNKRSTVLNTNAYGQTNISPEKQNLKQQPSNNEQCLKNEQKEMSKEIGGLAYGGLCPEISFRTQDVSQQQNIQSQQQIKPQSPISGFFGPKKEKIADQQIIDQIFNTISLTFAVKNDFVQNLVQHIQEEYPELIIKYDIQQLNRIQQTIEFQIQEHGEQTLNLLVQQYLIEQYAEQQQICKLME